MLLCMRSLNWITLGMLCLTAAAQPTEAPVSLGIVFDTSGSMGAKLARSRQMTAQFLKTADAQDQFFLIEANDRPVLTTPFTTDTYRLQDHLVFIQSKGRSALWDSVYLGLSEMKRGQNPRKALLVISDGGDNSSRYTEDQVAKMAREARIPIYAFGVNDSAGGRTTEELEGPGRLKEIAEQSGGRYFAVERLDDIPSFAAQVTGEVRSAAPIR